MGDLLMLALELNWLGLTTLDLLPLDHSLLLSLNSLESSLWLLLNKLPKLQETTQLLNALLAVLTALWPVLRRSLTISTRPYAYMAVSGDGFCKSAWNGFMLNMKHALEFAWAKVLAELFIFTGKISLVALNCGF